MSTEHLEVCPKKEVQCPNPGCDTKIQRCKISMHRQECMFEKVSCKYANIGCELEFLRRNLKEHETDSQQHLSLALDTIRRQENTLEMMQSKIEELTVNREQSGTLEPTPSRLQTYKFKFAEFQCHKASKNDYYSPPYYTSPGGYRMCINVCANGNGDGIDTHVSVFAYLMRGENDDHLPWPFTGTVTFELLNQLEDRNHHSGQATFPPDDDVSERVVDRERASTGYGRHCFIPHSALGYDSAKHCQFLKNDCLYFRIKTSAYNTAKPWLVT